MIDREVVALHEAAHIVAALAVHADPGPCRLWQGAVTMLDAPDPFQTAVIAAAGEEAVRIALRDQGAAFSEELEETFAPAAQLGGAVELGSGGGPPRARTSYLRVISTALFLLS